MQVNLRDVIMERAVQQWQGEFPCQNYFSLVLAVGQNSERSDDLEYEFESSLRISYQL